MQDTLPPNHAALSIQCTAPDGTTGTFLSRDGALVSPVCRDMVALLNWTRASGWADAGRFAGYPVGVYRKMES